MFIKIEVYDTYPLFIIPYITDNQIINTFYFFLIKMLITFLFNVNVNKLVYNFNSFQLFNTLNLHHDNLFIDSGKFVNKTRF